MESVYLFFLTIYLSIGGLITLYIEKKIYEIAEETGSELPPINTKC